MIFFLGESKYRHPNSVYPKIKFAVEDCKTSLLFIHQRFLRTLLVLCSTIFYIYMPLKSNATQVVLRLNFNSYGHIMAVGDAHMFPGFLTPVLA